MDNIPQINPSQDLKGQEEQGSILIPKINLEPLQTAGRGKKETKEKKEVRKRKFKMGKKLKIAGIILGVVLVFLVMMGFLSWRVYQKALVTKASVDNLMLAGQAQDLPQIKNELQATKVSIEELKNTYKSVSWLKIAPFVGGYLKDVEHGLEAVTYGLEAGDIVVEIIEPYADIIGFSDGEADQAESGAETAQDRLDFIVKTIPTLLGRVQQKETIYEILSKLEEGKHKT
ncbi:hypothetical protein KKB40_03605, partial [Patescibacteria group bacterium]|nr:hypothetical protein [Patescibacteria group bacterium]